MRFLYIPLPAMKKRHLLLIFLAVTIAGCATTEDFLVLDDRISQLEMKSVEMTKKSGRLDEQVQKIGILQDQRSQDSKGMYAGVRAEIEALRSEMQLLNGQLEEIRYVLQGVQEADRRREEMLGRLDRNITQNGDRIIRLEQYVGVDAGGKKPETPVEASTASPREETEEGLYQASKAAFDAGRYEEARQGFAKLIKTYPKSTNADNAQFWIGETYYREKWFEKAILEYQEVIKSYPNGNKVPAAGLKQGLSFQQLGDNAKARLFLNEVIRKFPKSKEAAIAKKALDGLQ